MIFRYLSSIYLADTTTINKNPTKLSITNWQTHSYIDDDIILNYTFYEIKHTIKVIVFIANLSLLANTSQ